MRSVLVLLPWVMLAGCFANASTTKKLADTVHEMNDAARWGQLGQASTRVQPDYRADYLRAHRGWGSRIQVADSEVVNLQVADDLSTAIALVAYSWYALDTMTLHQSVVRQRWEPLEEYFVLAHESVVQGDPKLLLSEEDAETSPSKPGSARTIARITVSCPQQY